MSLSPNGINVILCGLLLTSLNFAVTLQNMRIYGLTLYNMSKYVCSVGIIASMLLLFLPILTGIIDWP